MFNWFDLMRQAQGGAGFDNMARQFGLTPDQTQRAVAALLPAFAMGFQRNAMNPAAAMQLFQLMAGGHYPSFFESATQAFSPQGRQEGKAVLDQLFGSDQVSRRVADQAAQFSGVGTEVLNQILPLTAAILAGGLSKAMTSHGSMMGPFTEAWRGTAGGAQPSTGGIAGQTGAGAWMDLWRSWAGNAPEQPAPQQPSASNPFEEMMASFMGKSSDAKAQDSKSQNAKSRDTKPDAEKPTDSDPLETWGQMMETGREVQRQHLESLQSIFDGFWGPNPDRNGPRK
jgi:hypothetical protein